MRRLSPTERILFLALLAIVPAAICWSRWNIAVTPPPAISPPLASNRGPNLYSNFYAGREMPGDALYPADSALPSPDGKWIYTGSNGSAPLTFAKWNAHSGALVRYFGLSNVNTSNMVLSADGRTIGASDGIQNGARVVLFDTNTGKERRQIIKPPGEDFYLPGSNFALSNEFVALPTYDDVRLIQISDGRTVAKFQHQNREYYPKHPCFSRDTRQLAWIGFSGRNNPSYANGNSNDEIVWFDLKTKTRRGAVVFPLCQLLNGQFSGDGRVLLIQGWRHYWTKRQRWGGEDGTDRKQMMWAVDTHTGRKLWTWNEPNWSELSDGLTVSPDGSLFAIARTTIIGADSVRVTSIREVTTNHEVVQVPTGSPYTPPWSADSHTLYFLPPQSPDAGMVRLVEHTDGSWAFNGVPVAPSSKIGHLAPKNMSPR